MNVDAMHATVVFVVRRGIWILKSPPSANVVNQDCSELTIGMRDVLQETLHLGATFESSTAYTRIEVSSRNHHSIPRSVPVDGLHLEFRREILTVRAHAEVLGRQDG
jgi:hypothetical protein